MPRHLFDVGTLSVSVPTLTAPTAALFGWTGGGMDPIPTSPGNTWDEAIDGNNGTYALLTLNSGANYQFLRVDLGASLPIRSVQVTGLVGATLTGLRCYVSNTASTTNPSTGTQLGTPILPAGGTFETDTPITARYIYLSPAPGSTAGTYQIASVMAYVDVQKTIGTMQNIGISWTHSPVDLHAGVVVSRFPVDRGFGAAQVQISPQFADLDPEILALILAANRDPLGTTIGAGSTDLTPTAASVPLPEMGLTLVTKDSGGKIVRLRLNRVYAPGAKVDFNSGAFANGSADFYALTPKGGSIIGYWDFED